MNNQEEIYGMPADSWEALDRDEQLRTIQLDAVEQSRISQLQYRLQIYRGIVPPIYQEPFDFTKLSDSVDREAISKILEWDTGQKSLWIVGSSGRAKTRSVAQLIKTQIVDLDKSVAQYAGAKFTQLAITALANYEATSRIMREMFNSNLLVIDDLGKRSTSATWEVLFDVVEHRIAHKKKMIVTTNLTGKAFQTAINNDTIFLPLQRRIKEFFEVVTVDK